MKKLLGLLLCLASLWLAYGLCMEVFIAWYSGSEDQLDLRDWVHLALQVLVDLAAACFGWRLLRAKPSRTA